MGTKKAKIKTNKKDKVQESNTTPKIGVYLMSKVKDPKVICLAAKIIIVIVAIGLAIGYGKPFVQEVIAQSYATKAVSKGRVLMRGAQEVAREQMIAGMSMDDAGVFLTQETVLDDIVTTAKFEVYPQGITQVMINERGEIVLFECTLVYEDKRYDVSLNIDENTSVATLDPDYLPPQEEDPPTKK